MIESSGGKAQSTFNLKLNIIIYEVFDFCNKFPFINIMFKN